MVKIADYKYRNSDSKVKHVAVPALFRLHVSNTTVYISSPDNILTVSTSRQYQVEFTCGRILQPFLMPVVFCYVS